MMKSSAFGLLAPQDGICNHPMLCDNFEDLFGITVLILKLKSQCLQNLVTRGLALEPVLFKVPSVASYDIKC